MDSIDEKIDILGKSGWKRQANRNPPSDNLINLNTTIIMRAIILAVTLSVSSTELNDDRLQALTADLCRIINNEFNIEAVLAEGPAQKGAKGEPITLGIIILTFLSSGSAIALLNILKSYFDREPSINMKIKREDGTEIAIAAKNMSPEQIKEIIGTLE